MNKLRFDISVSLDGFVAGPNQTLEEPLGRGGEGLHHWAVRLRSWRESHGLEGGAVNEDDKLLRESTTNVGATIMGRNMFGGQPGPWGSANPWRGWWGDSPPFRHPVFVLTHHSRRPLEFDNGTTFTFVTESIESALEEARQAAGTLDIAIAGGPMLPVSTWPPASSTRCSSTSCRSCLVVALGSSTRWAPICTGSSLFARWPARAWST